MCQVDWLTGRNICRRHCMDLVSIETREENEFVKQRMINGLIRSVDIRHQLTMDCCLSQVLLDVWPQVQLREL